MNGSERASCIPDSCCNVRAEQLPDKVAFIDVSSTGVRYQGTFESHIDRLLRLANSMRSVLGLRPGDRFAVLAANSHEYMELYHAAMFGAGIINPLNIRFAPSELAYVLNDSGSNVVFTDASFAALLDRARDDGARVDRVVMIGGDSDCGAPGESRGSIGLRGSARGRAAGSAA